MFKAHPCSEGEVKVAPFPISDSIQMCPPFRSTIFSDCQSDAVPIILSVVKPLKDGEYGLSVLRSNANPVVPYGENPPIAISPPKRERGARFP